ncbi:hypothetical protein [Virgibacillus subterraneus]|nr:hypothetical protein [Virgibacillus subterraneus]
MNKPSRRRHESPEGGSESTEERRESAEGRRESAEEGMNQQKE